MLAGAFVMSIGVPMATVRHRAPVVVRHPITEQFEAMYRGKEVEDAAVVKAYPWLFADDVEQATAAPGEKRSTRRA